MKYIFALLLCVTCATAHAEQRVVAQTSFPASSKIFMLNTPCGSAAWTAQQVTASQNLRWGCWRYNETGVQVEWSTGHAQQIWFWDLWRWDGNFWQSMGWERMNHTMRQLGAMK